MGDLGENRKRTRFREQRGLCFYCHIRMHGDATWEHLVARTHGGDNRWSNLVLAHSKCNGLVGTIDVVSKFALSEIGRIYGSDAFFLLASSMRKRANSRERTPLHSRRPKRPPAHRFALVVGGLAEQLPAEFLLMAA